jgi:spermidine/putrescine-binding protein
MDHAETIELLKSGKLTRRQMTKLLASVGVGLAASPLMPRQAAAESVDLTLLEWNGYEYESFHPEYNAKYGGQPEVTFFAATEDAFQKMRAGFQCDLVHPCTGEVNMFKDAGLIKPLETDRIPRWGEIIPYLLTVKGVEIDGDYWFSPWDWGFSTVAYNPDVIDVENPSFEIFVDPKYKGKTALDSSIGVNIAIAGVIGGWAEPLNPTEAELETAPDIFKAMLENARFIWTDSTQLEQAWGAGDVGASYVYGSASRRMKDEGYKIVVMDPVLPWMCGLCVSSNGEGSEDQAYDYINAMLDPVGGVSLFDEYGYGHGNKNTFALIDPEKLYAADLNDPEGLLSRGVFFDEVPPEKNAKLLQYWQEAQAGLD